MLATVAMQLLQWAFIRLAYQTSFTAGTATA